MLRGAHTSVYNVLWQPFVISLGLPVSTLGLLNSLGGSGLTATVAQAFGGWSADRFGRKPFLVAGSLAFAGAYGLLVVAGATGVGAILAAGALLYGLATVSRPAMSSITAESVRRDKHGSAFSMLTFAGTVPGILVPALAGWAAVGAGYLPLFALCMGVEAIVLALILRRIAETAPARAYPSWSEAVTALRRSAAPPPGLKAFALACAADVFFWGMGYGLLYGMLTDRYGIAPSQLGLLAATMSVSWALVQLPIGRYIDRHSVVPLMILSEALGVPLMLIWMTQSSFELLLLAQVIMGIAAATWIPASSTYLARRTEPGSRAEAYSRLSVFRGLVSFPAPAIGGLLYAWGGIFAPMAVNLAGIFVTIAFLATCPADHPQVA